MYFNLRVNNKYMLQAVEDKNGDGDYYIAYPLEEDIKLIAQQEERNTVIEGIPTDTNTSFRKFYGRFYDVKINEYGGISFRIKSAVESVHISPNGEIEVEWNYY